MTTEIYDDGVERPAHSKLGASSAERWMNCPGSTALIDAFAMPESDEPDYRREGIAGHEAAADCLARDIDTWEIVGRTYYNTEITPEMAYAVQQYLDRVRPSIDRERGFHGQQFFIEAMLAAPERAALASRVTVAKTLVPATMATCRPLIAKRYITPSRVKALRWGSSSPADLPRKRPT